ncbi:MAG: hypothetical protein CMB31_05365 [Euryarchaeota archaeon]|nr:hypothetical protein [Euryarchaeota archaeon]|tara:strand:+ start:633 stop:2804 length:2172 start_codon:yes stop_codon:yes gene_type:complete
MSATTKGNDELNDRLCVACQIEELKITNPNNWCPRCTWMIHPHCTGIAPLRPASQTDVDMVNEILQKTSSRATLSRIREWHNNLDSADSDWIFRIQDSHIDPIIDDERGNEIRTRIFEQIQSSENEHLKEWLMNRGFPLPGGCWMQISSMSAVPHSISIDGIVNTGPRFPHSQLIEIISKMDEWELRAVNWHRFSQLLAELGINQRDHFRELRRNRHIVHARHYRHLMANGELTSIRSFGAVISRVISRWNNSMTNLRGSFLSGLEGRETDIMDVLPFFIDQMSDDEIASIPWLRRWKEETKNWSNPEIFEHNFDNFISIRSGRLFLRVKNKYGKLSLRRIPSDFRIISALISAQLSPPGTSIHDSLQLLLTNWHNDSMVQAVPNDADRRAARLLADVEKGAENVTFSEKERSLLIKGNTGTEYQIKVNRTLSRHADKFQLSARVRSYDEWEKICTHASDELKDLPIGDQIATLALICSRDLENNTAISTIHMFLVSKNKISMDPEMRQEPDFNRQIRLRDRVRDFFEDREVADAEIRRRIRHERPNFRRYLQYEWDYQNGELRIEEEHPFPLNDDVLGDVGNRNRIPNLLINALVGFNAAPIGALARLPSAPGGSFRLLTIANEVFTQQEVDVLQSTARINGWSLVENFDGETEENQEMWVKEQHRRFNHEPIRIEMYDLLSRIQEEIDPNGRPWWARIEDRVRHFRQVRNRVFWNFQNEER